ncbi:MAG TPA: energy transducer TonB [Bryobacteraceae bacterium]|jgi:protein TonB|nr:energy transducer TonB [Bryobacteraceae bacterium]
MPGHLDILDRSDSLNKPLLGSVVLHFAAFGTLVLWGVVVSGPHESWGDSNSGGAGSVAINVVPKILLPSRSGIVNPLANDTESAVPTPPPAAKPKKLAPVEEPDAIPLKSRVHPKPSEVARSAQNNWRAKQQDLPNQLYSQTGPALVSNMVGQVGSGGVGFGQGTPFGNRFGNYVTILRQRVAEKWHAGDVDSRIHTLPPAIVTFDLMRDGSVHNVRISQTSGNQALDYSAQRAIYDASPFPPLPAAYERNDATIEFWFELRR